MTNEISTGTVPTTAIVQAPKVLPKTSTITLVADDSILQIIAERKADDTARTYVISTDSSKKAERGMTLEHGTFDAALVAIANSAAKAEKLGWVRRAAGRGFAKKPDAFTALPAAPKAKK